jgi:hypothetical protein
MSDLAILIANANEAELRVINTVLKRANEKPAVLVTMRDGKRYVVVQEDEHLFTELIGLSAEELAERVAHHRGYFGGQRLRRYGNVDEMYRSLGMYEVQRLTTADRTRVWGT